MNLPVLVIFLAVALAHFVICLTGWRGGYLATKPLLVPLLLCFYLLSASHISLLAVLALLCGLVGDVALLFPRKPKGANRPAPPFLVGLGAFLLGHLFYIVLFFCQMPTWPPVAVLLLALCAGGLLLVALRTLYPRMGVLAGPAMAYTVVLLTMAFVATLSALTIPAPIRLPGALLFLLSDYILGRSIFFQKEKYTDFWVMLTYLSAQFLLILSLI